jgi:hypothetical protein
MKWVKKENRCFQAVLPGTPEFHWGLKGGNETLPLPILFFENRNYTLRKSKLL